MNRFTAEVDRFPASVVRELQAYVYLYSDPETGEPIYIGKGRGQRAFAHLDDISKPRLAELRKLGKRPRIELLKWGLTDEEAHIVEATAIDLYGLDQLDNRVAGHHGMRADVRKVIASIAAKPVTVRHPSILFSLSRMFRYDLTPGELYDVTRAAWRINKQRAERAEFAMAVYRGVIQEVYVPEAWVRGHSTIQASGIRTWNNKSLDERWEFVGRVAPDDIRKLYVGRAIEGYQPSQTPFQYVNV